jgi:acid phosphatase (class A)
MYRTIMACLIAMLATPASAAEPYITAKAMDLAVLVPPPPAKGSAADAADMRAVLAAQAHASPARRARTLPDSDETVFVMFGGLVGPKFAPATLPKTTAMFERIGDSEDDTLDAIKPVFGRVRPWLANPAVKAYAKPTKSPSYPSGHTTRIAIAAAVLADMLPEKKREIWARAADYAESRVIGGMHYPTDIDAGWRTGAAMTAVLFQLPGFRADLEAAKAELRAALAR